MEYVSDLGYLAPTLKGVRLHLDAVQPTFERLVHNVDLTLTSSGVRADLSACDVLYWNGQGGMIDFPQAVGARANPSGFDLLRRNLDRLCRYRDPYRMPMDPLGLSRDLWERHMPTSGRR